MREAIIGGSSLMRSLVRADQDRRTPYGQAQVFLGEGDAEDLVFLPRHGPDHRIPHRINYRANLFP
jgi:purine nucleoside phosphorylase